MFFITLGMFLGYLFSTQEGAVMASIVLGSVLLFLSNLVVPLESIAPTLSNLIKYNPYVLASELLRKAMLFKIEMQGEALMIIVTLFGASFLFLAFMIIFSSLRSRARLKLPEGVSLEENPLTESAKKEPARFMLEHKYASNKQELLTLVSDMTKAEFEENVNDRENRIADWVEKEMADKKLASKLRKAGSRKELVKLLEEDVKKQTPSEDDG